MPSRSSMDLMSRVQHDFTYHAPNDEQRDFYNSFRNDARRLASTIVLVLPESRELSLALTKLEEAVFWGNAACARHGLNEPSKEISK